MSLKETQKRGNRTVVAILVIGIAVYLGFTPLFEQVPDGVGRQVVGSSFGAIFVIILTMYLLNKQTEIEQESKKSERVFDEKVHLYKHILESTKIMLEDGQLDSKEILALPFTLIQMQMVGGDEAIKVYTSFFEKINDIYESDENEVVKIPESQAQEVFSLLSRFSVQCRVDLGISDTPIDETIFARAITALQQSNDAVKGKRDTSKYTLWIRLLLKVDWFMQWLKILSLKIQILLSMTLKKHFQMNGIQINLINVIALFLLD